MSIKSYDIEDGDLINFRMEQVGGKPVIYLYSPSDVDISVKLSLSPEWSFSAIYPFVTPKQEDGLHVEWNVRTHQDGNLTEKNSGLDVSYLFWEAKTNSDTFPHSPASELQSVDVFSPTCSTLCDADSIVVSVDKVTAYLNKSLKALGLHTEARTSFITYWLPSILKHEYIALRFVPQPAYERAASLSISPQPDVVTRVFMLFRGICKEHLVDWSNAQMRVEKDVGWWADVVGVDLSSASDMALFRVLEWGGMEVLI
ncbi:ubiquitin family protein [Suillus americanus]|nr:ubiquitin family protein [Suillus americanus]